MTFATESQKVSSLKICLLEIDIPVDNDVLINHEAGMWFNKLTPGTVEATDDHGVTGSYANTNEVVYNIQSVVVDGTPYLKVDSLVNLRLNTEAFYYDYDNRTIYIVFLNFDPPLGKVIKLGNVNGYINKVDPDNGAYYNNIYYDPRILNVPVLKRSKDPLFFGVLRFDSASITLINTDGNFDYFEDGDVWGQPARIKLGYGGLDYDDYKTIYTGFIEDFDYNFDTFTLKLLNNRKKISRTLPIRRFTVSDYSGLLDEDEQKVKPIAYGLITNAPCTLIESSDPYTFMFMDTTDHDAEALTKVYNEGVEVTVASSDLSAGTFVLSSANYTLGDEVTADFTGADGIANGLEVVKDILDIYANTKDNAFNYNQTEWTIAQNLVDDIGLYIGEEKKINEIFEKILISIGAAFFDQADGKWTSRVYDEDRTPIRTIYSDEWLSDPKKKLPSKEFLSSVKINFNEDINNSKFEEHTNDTYDVTSFNRYKRRVQKSFDTILTTRPKAVTRSEVIMSRSKVIKPTVSRVASFQNIELELMDFIIAEHDRRSATTKRWGVYEVVSKAPNIDKANINLLMKYVKSYTLPSHAEFWIHRTQAGGYSYSFNGAAYGNDVFVIVGVLGQIQSSSDGITWTAQTQDSSFYGTFYGIVFGNNLFVCIGNSGEIQTSPDGITWTTRTPDDSYSGNFYGIAYGNGIFVAVGSSGEIQTSPDGITWTVRTPDDSYASNFRSIAYGNGIFVAVGYSGEIQTSPNGITWTVQSPRVGFGAAFYGVVYGNGVFVAVGSSGEIETSPDGITWIFRTPDDSFSGVFRGISYIDTLFVVVGDTGEIQTSPDGITWTVQLTANSYSDTFYCTVASDEMFIAAGTGGEIQTSVVTSYV